MKQKIELLINQLVKKGIQDQRVLAVMERIPRHCFVDKALAHQAYEDITLPIGAQQTISQPYIVACMTELLQLHPQSRVLEIGTGSGYQTAILSQLAAHVYTIERINSLFLQAKKRFKQLKLNNITARYGDGYQGWHSQAPFDAIIVTAAAPRLPETLCDQLTIGGRLVLPLGTHQQTLMCFTNLGNKCIEEAVASVRFVPLISGMLE